MHLSAVKPELRSQRPPIRASCRCVIGASKQANVPVTICLGTDAPGAARSAAFADEMVANKIPAPQTART
jgi:hypothetical protein